METVDKLSKKIDEILNAREQELTGISNELADVKTALAEAEKEVIAKTKAGSTKEYIAAKAKYDKDKDVVHMLEQRMASIKDKALVTEEEYLVDVKSVKDECARLVSNDKIVATKMLKNLWGIYKDEAEELDHANKVLRSYQHNLYRDEDCINPANGKICNTKIQEFKDYSLVNLLHSCFLYDVVRELIGVKDND